MGKNKKRKRVERPGIHPRNKYADKPPDFALLASLYPSFEPYVFYSRDNNPRIDWTDFNATRELTRVLLLHDHGISWWIPDGQLCPTVPNRSNYIHWIDDLLGSSIIANIHTGSDVVKGFDIGTGANCIYPLLGASLLGWSFVGSDMTDVAIEWAVRNVQNNPHISQLVEIRKVDGEEKTFDGVESHSVQEVHRITNSDISRSEAVETVPSPSSSIKLQPHATNNYSGPPILLGVVMDGEQFDFCMCNPPFFESMEEAGLNPKTSCGGTLQEMVCPGGELAFISRIIEDSVQLKQSFRWYTSMVGRKSNLKLLISLLWEVGVTIVKTTEFVQGQTCRWGLAWSFVPPTKKILSTRVAEKNNLSFMLEGIQRQYSAAHVLQSIESFFCSVGASCKSDLVLFNVEITASMDHWDAILQNEAQNMHEAASCQFETSNESPENGFSFRVSVLQQIPGTLLVRASLQQRQNSASGVFSFIFQRLEQLLKSKFCGEKALRHK